ncbi:hypothetical protein [Bacteroides thetaiotaomicron]|uniref:hypothetical protein n=1 Tax=Bacteroides thetaiotaomicron TaxID=818 RepID=UPI001F5B7115|nr:hypothetical protein [Bacteroides thetaiotaomicron]
MNKSKGTFWSTPKDMSDESTYIYWQQAHAMDVVIYSYKRIKDTNKQLAATYRTYLNAGMPTTLTITTVIHQMKPAS